MRGGGGGRQREVSSAAHLCVSCGDVFALLVGVCVPGRLLPNVHLGEEHAEDLLASPGSRGSGSTDTGIQLWAKEKE